MRRKRKIKPDAEIVLICNPRAGGRWKELAGILDAEEARFARRIVTDSVEDIATALDDLGRESKLLCIYGGDGTIQRVLDRLPRFSSDDNEGVHLALLGGGTMNVASRWLGFSRNPARNFRHVVRSFRNGDLLLREVPVLEIRAGDNLHRGFTFGVGPIVRLLDAYESGPKGKVAALGTAARAIAGAWLKATSYAKLVAPMQAEVELDGEVLPYDSFSAVFANTTGQINPMVEPFSGDRTRDSFYCAAYSVSAREFSLAMPFLIRGWLPIDLDLGAWFRPSDEPAKIVTDPRYVNRTASAMTVRTDEELYTIDGEILAAPGGEITVGLGPLLKLAVGPNAVWKMAADSVRSTRR